MTSKESFGKVFIWIQLFIFFYHIHTYIYLCVCFSYEVLFYRCNFLNFARNTRCLQCKEKPPERHLNPGEWECDS